MNKKQLTMQNSSLFAELERKAKELEILNIRLEESEQKAKNFADEIEALKESLEKAEAENAALIKKNNELETELAESKAKSSIPADFTEFFTPPVKEEIVNSDNEAATENILESANFTIDEIAPTEETQINIETEVLNNGELPTNAIPEENTVCEPTPSNQQPLDSQTLEEPKEDIDDSTITFSPTFIKDVSPKTDATPSIDLLRDYAARIIGKVTRVTAEVLSKVNAVNDDVGESLKTLALGKNESFKFQIMELAKSKADPEKTMAEMDLLADEAIVYLRSI